MKRAVLNVLYPVLSLVLFLAVWAAAAAVYAKPFLLPDPLTVASEFFSLFTRADFYVSVAVTFLRAALSFALSFALALGLSLTASAYPSVGRFVSPAVSFFRAAPTMSVILLAVVWLSSSAVPVLVGLLIAFPIIYSAFSLKLAEQTKTREMCGVFGVSKRDQIRFVCLPSLYPVFGGQCYSTLPLTVKVVIAGEVMSFPKYGMGEHMYAAKISLDTASLLAWTTAAVIICFALEYAVKTISKAARRRKCR